MCVFSDFLINFATEIFRKTFFIDKMNHKIVLITLLISAVCSLTSCLGDSNEIDYTTYNDVAISSVSLGTMKRYYTVKSSKNEDSTVVSTFSGNTYPMYIDQKNRLIYNADSLPYGTDAKHVILTVTTKNSAIPTLKSLTSDSISSISTSDSIDLSVDRTISVFSLSGEYKRDYTIKLAVHQEEADTFRWNAMPVDDNAARIFNGLTDINSFALNDRIYAYGIYNGKSTLLSTNASDGANWKEELLPNSIGNKIQIVSDNSSIYMLTDETLYTTTDCSSWTSKPASGIENLVCTFDKNGVKRLYAISTKMEMMESRDCGTTWTIDATDNSPEFMPVSRISGVTTSLISNDDIFRIVMVGNGSTGAYASVWSKIIDTTRDQNEPWLYNTPRDNQKYMLPNSTTLSIANYSTGLLAVGNEYAEDSNEPSAYMLYSRDNGLTWGSNSLTKLPAGFSAKDIAVTTTKDNHIWVISNGATPVWRGRLNKLGWETIQKDFLK